MHSNMILDKSNGSTYIQNKLNNGFFPSSSLLIILGDLVHTVLFRFYRDFFTLALVYLGDFYVFVD